MTQMSALGSSSEDKRDLEITRGCSVIPYIHLCILRYTP